LKSIKKRTLETGDHDNVFAAFAARFSKEVTVICHPTALKAHSISEEISACFWRYTRATSFVALLLTPGALISMAVVRIASRPFAEFTPYSIPE
jgi:hypothetical protein